MTRLTVKHQAIANEVGVNVRLVSAVLGPGPQKLRVRPFTALVIIDAAERLGCYPTRQKGEWAKVVAALTSKGDARG